MRVALVLACIAWVGVMDVRADDEPATPAARRIYDEMTQAFRDLNTLYFESEFRWRVAGEELGRSRYKLWLKKPNYFRLEAFKPGDDAPRGVLVGDGRTAWIYWPAGRPRFEWEHFGKFAEEYERLHATSYMTMPATAGRFSIAHQTDLLGTNIPMTILDASMFHGYVDSLQAHLDGVRLRGVERIDNQPCDRIEVSFLNGQRVWTLSVSRRDHLPRKLTQVIRQERSGVFTESWTQVSPNVAIDDDKFAWTPPPEWTAWKLPDLQEGLLESGTPAPDFTLTLTDGKPVRLADLKGRVVWLFEWRVGCPPCHVEMRYLQRLYARYSDKGLTVLGVNLWDSKDLVDDMLKRYDVTFPVAWDTSREAQALLERYETLKGMGAVPLTYVIDRKGKVRSAWYGFDEQQADAVVAELLSGD